MFCTSFLKVGLDMKAVSNIFLFLMVIVFSLILQGQVGMEEPRQKTNVSSTKQIHIMLQDCMGRFSLT